MSGLERGGQLRFLTLTSSNESPDTCQKDWRKLYMRLKRRGLLTAYIKVPELSKNGKQHLHIIFRGQYIAQAMISELWQQLHQAKIVDIRGISKNPSKSYLAAYMAKYLSKENFFRYSWSWSWVWKGFVKDWNKLKSIAYHLTEAGIYTSMKDVLNLWRKALHLGDPDLFRQRLAAIENSI